MKLFLASLTLALTSLLFSCQNQSAPSISTAQSEAATAAGVPDDFEAFYQKFLSDSLFQVAHIVWPLHGPQLVTAADSSASQLEPHHWTPEDWVMHHPTDYSDGSCTRELQMLGDVIVLERIRLKAANYGIERRFARQPDTGEWALIYYSSLREM